jgi:hypothetical protein
VEEVFSPHIQFHNCNPSHPERGVWNSRFVLFVLFSFYVLHPEGVCGLLQKKPAAAPAYKPQQKKIPAPSVRCAHFSGYASPLQINERSKETKKRKRS